MTLENPVSHLKIHGFGAFQQRAGLFLYAANKKAAAEIHPDKEAMQRFLKSTSMMFGLFNAHYAQHENLPASLMLEQEAWQLLQPDVSRWIGNLHAYTEAAHPDITALRGLITDGELVMKRWGVISSSFKQKLELSTVDETPIRELITQLREKAADTLAGSQDAGQ